MGRLIISMVLLAAIAMVRCSFTGLTGGGSDLPDKVVVGRVVTSDLAPAAYTQVTIIPAEYNSVKDAPISPAFIDTTDSSGTFCIGLNNSGVYTIQAVHLSQRTRLMVTGVLVNKDTTIVPDDTLRVPGSIKAILPEGIDNTQCWVYIPGTTIDAQVVGSEGYAVLDSVPAGIIPSVCFSTKNDSLPAAIRYDFVVLPGDTAVLAKPVWHYSRRLHLNTTVTGAYVGGNVIGFPVLVRLSGNTFDFSKALPNGEDLRFTKADGSALPYEIERWDPVAGLAEVWINVDTIYGNNGTQHIQMYWGNQHAEDESDGAAVFNSVSGFAGVWHLAETSGTYAADASPYGYAGIYKGGLPRNVESPLGICQSIVRPDSDFVDMGNVLNPGTKNISIGVWVKRAAFGTQQAMIAKTNGDGPSTVYGYLFSLDLFDYPHFYLISGGANFGDDGSFDVSSNQKVTDSTQWHYLFVAVDRSDNSRCRLYIDGIDRTGTIRGEISLVADVVNTLSLRIGTENDNNYSFKGAIDEVTIAFTARSADWVTLSYLNQKEKDGLVQW